MVTRPERLIPAGSSVITGHFRCGADYGTRRPQGTDDWLVILTVTGGGLVGQPGAQLPLRRGDTVLLRPGHAHAYGTDPRMGAWELLWAHLLVPDAWLDLLDWPEPRPGVLHLRAAAALHVRAAACLREADAWCRRAAPRRERLALNAVERALLLLAAANPLDPSGRLDPRLTRAMDAMLRDLAGRWPASSLARHAGLSPSRFAHLFRRQVGLSPGRWLERERLRRAAALLDATVRPVAEIAAEVGFSDPFYFSQRFRAWAGRSPREFRAGR